MRDHDGKFLHYVDKSQEGDEAIVTSLGQLIERNKKFLEWNFENETLEDISSGEITRNRKGGSQASGDTWNHKRKSNRKEKFE